MANKTGARENFFKLHEGKPGDMVCAMFDTPNKKLRLYCIRYSKMVVLLGGGAAKPKDIQSWQEDPDLTREVNLMMKVSDDIYAKMKDGDLQWTEDGTELVGDFNFENEL